MYVNFPSFIVLAVALLLFGQQSNSEVLPDVQAFSITRKPLLFEGRLVDESGKAVSGGLVQLWQTDVTGQYRHPRSSGGSDPTFQYFGTASTNDAGGFFFKTYKPGMYPGRPPHIHFKVWMNGTAVLTSQFYFSENGSRHPEQLLLHLDEATDEDGDAVLVTTKTIAIDLGGGDSTSTTALTPSQAQGPYYPTLDFFGMDNDLTVVVQDDLHKNNTFGYEMSDIFPVSDEFSDVIEQTSAATNQTSNAIGQTSDTSMCFSLWHMLLVQFHCVYMFRFI